MSSTALYRIRRATRRPWLRVAAFCGAGVAAALASAFGAPLIPIEIARSIGADAVDQILSVLATSMLPVATFSLSIMVQAYGGATSNVTPRAVTLLMEDTRAQNAVASFIGAFVYSVVGLIALKTHFYGDQGRVILFGLTLVVLASVVVTLVRWIDTLAHLGRVGETVDAIEEAACAAIRRRAEAPYLGGLPWCPAPEGAIAVQAQSTGYIQHVDSGALEALGEASDLVLHLAVLPGSFVHRGRLLVEIDGNPDAATLAGITKPFVIGDRRSFDDDPRFGIIVLTEVASRGLSAAINDPGTPIDVIGTQVRVLTLWAECRAAPTRGEIYPRLRVPGIEVADLFADAFRPIGRDGAACAEVGVRLQKALAALHAIGGPDFQAAARREADNALARAEKLLDLPDDLEVLRAAHALVGHRG
ncbi:DUF2254 domain-containing protein [Methylobacterium sp. WL19]|uniref:DUF2254 domain-containing protein n=1 Tax=Methylobacterium sp. WL19 TaxID=2603896 RepID=UPI0011C70B2F|nr:DUF2254 domain-containing protein [Methylobacterium sp. WL19]TXN26388.1 DUF2254 domain-containing protein [Methylobacterium sp. WL19]